MFRFSVCGCFKMVYNYRMTEGQARDELDSIASAAFAANVTNPDAMAMDNEYFVSSHIAAIKRQHRGNWDYRFAAVYVDRLSAMMRR